MYIDVQSVKHNPAAETVRVGGVVTLDAAVGVGDGEVIDGDVLGHQNIGVVPHTVTVQLPEELNSKQAIQDPEEDKEQGNIVDLLA